MCLTLCMCKNVPLHVANKLFYSSLQLSVERIDDLPKTGQFNHCFVSLNNFCCFWFYPFVV